MKKIILLCAILTWTMTLDLVNQTVVAEAVTVAPKAYPSLPAFLLKGVSRVKAVKPTEHGPLPFFGTAFAVDLSDFNLKGRNYVITAAHVILDEKGVAYETIEVEVNLALHNTQVWAAAKVVAVDKGKDIAILAVDIDVVGHSKLAKSDNLKIGDAIALVGCPAGTAVTVSFGYLSAKDLQTFGKKHSSDFWQGSAAIYPGNSGGPVYDPNTEEIIGIAVAGMGAHGFAANVDFFVPITVLRPYIQDHIADFEKFEKK